MKKFMFGVALGATITVTAIGFAIRNSRGFRTTVRTLADEFYGEDPGSDYDEPLR